MPVFDWGAVTLSSDEIDSYLRLPGRFAALASLRRDGSPVVAPMGYYYEGGFLYFASTPQRGATRRLRRDPRVSVTVFDHEPLHAFVAIHGAVEEVEDLENRLALSMHHGYPKPGIEDQAEFDRIWLSAGRVVFRLSTDYAFGMDQRKAPESVWALGMPDAKTGAEAKKSGEREASR